MDDANFPCWAVLVPRIDGVEELTDLTAEEQELLWNETLAVTKALQVREEAFAPLSIPLQPVQSTPSITLISPYIRSFTSRTK